MKYCVMCNLRLETPAKSDTLHDNIQVKIGGKKVWGETINSKGIEDKYPTNTLEIRFDNEADMDEVYDFIKDKMTKIPVLKGTVSKHYCYHDEVGTNKSCEPIDSFEK